MSMFKVPVIYNTILDVQKKWLELLKLAQKTIDIDEEQQKAAADGVRIKTRALPPELVGTTYARYCNLVNQMYDAYLNNVQLQRAPYILEIITVIMKRIYELRNELVHIIVNDYIYIDSALSKLFLTPLDIEIVVPYHIPLESRSDNVEKILQQMWVDALKRKKDRERVPKVKPPRLPRGSLDFENKVVDEEDEETPPPSVHTIIPEEYIHSLVIQRHERYRQWHLRDVRQEALNRKQYFVTQFEPAPIEVRTKAALLVQTIYREFMKIKRKRFRDNKRDVLLGIIADPFKKKLSFYEENNKVYEKRRQMRMEIKKSYIEELENKKTRLILLRKDCTIDDITDEIREWFKEWYYNYQFFPQYPYDLEGGTLVVVRGDYPTVDEQLEADKKAMNETMGKTKEQIQAEKKQAKKDAALKAEADRITKIKNHKAELKEKCDPFSDPGYLLKPSGTMEKLMMALHSYRASWSIYDDLEPEKYGETIYGYMKPLLVEELMKEMHFACREIVDQLMRIDLKMLIKIQQQEWKKLGWNYPKMKARVKPKRMPVPKILVLDEKLLMKNECVFDLGIVSKPTVKFSDIFGDTSYAAYEYNIKDPDASFPLSCYGDIKRRLMLSCVLGCGIEPGATRRKAVMLLGPEGNGNTFLADTVAGELNAIKIDISPEVFTAVEERPHKVLTQVFVTARAFQPAVIFMKNIERVFAKKVPPAQKYLKANVLKSVLGKVVKSIQTEDKVIFIATCSDPWSADTKRMLSMFDEVLLVPRTDYGTLSQFFRHKLQSIRSMPRDYPVQPLAQLFQGFGFADIIEVFNEVMTAERICRLNIEELVPAEIVQKFVDKQLEPLTKDDYQQYVDFYILNSELKKEREEYATINFVRADIYSKTEKKAKAAAKKNA